MLYTVHVVVYTIVGDFIVVIRYNYIVVLYLPLATCHTNTAVVLDEYECTYITYYIIILIC